MELKKGRYRHFKGMEYELLGVATHSETLEPMVVYRALYGEGGACGSVRLPCGMPGWTGGSTMAPVFSISENKKQGRMFILPCLTFIRLFLPAASGGICSRG